MKLPEKQRKQLKEILRYSTDYIEILEELIYEIELTIYACDEEDFEEALFWSDRKQELENTLSYIKEIY